MADAQASLTPFYRGWGDHNALLIRTVERLTPEQLAIHPAGLPDSLATIATHIAGGRAFWFHGFLGEGDAALQRYDDWDKRRGPRTAGEIVDALAETWALVSDCLARWTPEMLDDKVTGDPKSALTRQSVIWQVLGHDIHHGGEISVTLGSHGLQGLDAFLGLDD